MLNPGKKFLTPVFAALLLLPAALSFSQSPTEVQGPPAPDELVIERFTSGVGPDGLPVGWKPFIFPKKHTPTLYTIEKENGSNCLRAESHASASAIYREFPVEARDYPYLKWRWKITNTIKQGTEGQKSGDDYAARIYVMFKYEPQKATLFDKIKYTLLVKMYGTEPPGRVLNYVWANRVKKEETLFSPYTDKVAMIAVESGEDKVATWMEESRNVYEDFKKAFHEEPPQVTGVVIMTDTDNTGEDATAFYGDIRFAKRP